MVKRSRSEQDGERPVPKILVLTDLGKDIDDSIALLLLARQAQLGRCQIAGVVAGGGSCRGRARAAKALLDAVLRLNPRAVLAPPAQDHDFPCIPGASVPITETMRSDISWTAKVVTDVTGGVHVPSASGGLETAQEVDGPAAAQTIVDICRAHGEALKILCIGPVTDLAHAVRLDRDAVMSVGAVHFQGQCVFEDGKVLPDSKAFNFQCDMDAATEVLHALLPRVPVWMLGKHAAYQIKLDGTHFARWDGAAGHWPRPRFLEAVVDGLVHLCTDARSTFDRVFSSEAGASFAKAMAAGAAARKKELAATLPFLSCPYDALAALSMFPEAAEHFEVEHVDANCETDETDAGARVVRCIGVDPAKAGVKDPDKTRTHLLNAVSAALCRSYVGAGPNDTAFASLPPPSTCALPAQMPDPLLVPSPGTTLKVVVGTTNVKKVQSVREALEAGGRAVEVVGLETASGVPGQPVGATETFGGAANRARQAREAEPEADIWIGLENGLLAVDATVSGTSVLPHPSSAAGHLEGVGHGVWFEAVACATLCRWNGESMSLGSSMGVQVPLFQPSHSAQDGSHDWLAEYSGYFFDTQLPTAGFDTAMHHSGGWLARPECLRAATASSVGRLLPKTVAAHNESNL